MSIVLEGLTKRYASHVVVDRVSLEIADGELLVLLGASGSGKSTILRLIAGLARPDEGRIVLKGRDVTGLSPQQRGTGFVFQNYSIFRHMTVAQNIEFGLKIRGVAAAERRRRCEELLDLVELAGLGSRYASQISGGQQQRVALARALAYEPNVLLLDEPFGALDARIRVQLRQSLLEVQERLGVTTILVTHDQDEAFELGDRVGVLERGRLLEVGKPSDLYERPRTLFVATFLGSGNVLVGRAMGRRAEFGTLTLPIPEGSPHERGSPVQLLVRPEEIELAAEKPGDDRPVLGRGRIVKDWFAGSTIRARIRLPRLPGVRQIAPTPPFGEEDFLIDALVPSGGEPPPREPWVVLSRWRILEPPPLSILVLDTGLDRPVPLAVARDLAGRTDAAVSLLCMGEDAEETEPRHVRLKNLAEEHGLAGAEIVLRFGRSDGEAEKRLREGLYDLVLLSPRSDAGDDPDDLVTDLLQAAVAPILIARGEPRPIRRLLLATAAGEPGKTTVRGGARLAARLGATLTLLHVSRGDPSEGTRVESHLGKAAATARGLDVGCEVRLCRAGDPAAAIVSEAREGGHDVIVIGAHGPGPRSIKGREDVMLRILAEADRPVLVVPDGTA